MKMNSLIDPKKRDEARRQLLNPDFKREKPAPDRIPKPQKTEPKTAPEEKPEVPKNRTPSPYEIEGLNNALRHAIFYNDDFCEAKRLISIGADINSYTYQCGWSEPPPLLEAIQFGGRMEKVKKILELGADPNAVFNSHTLLAADPEYLELLISKGANVNAKPYGTTALQHYAAKGDIGIVKLLISAGAEIDAKDCFGDTALKLAKKAGHKEIVELLKEHGAKERWFS